MKDARRAHVERDDLHSRVPSSLEMEGDMLPEAGDEVLVAFEHADVRRPYIVGAIWNDGRPPER